MATDTTPEYLRGFLIPLSLGSENIWTAQSNYTTFDTLAGDPEPQQTNPFRLYATGQQTNTSDLSITSRRAGYAGLGAGSRSRIIRTRGQYTDETLRINRADGHI